MKNSLIKNQSDLIDISKINNNLQDKIVKIESKVDENLNMEKIYNELNNNSDDLIEKLLASNLNEKLNIQNDNDNVGIDNVLKFF